MSLRRRMSVATKADDAPARLLSGIGLAARAGRVRVGFEAVSRSIRRGEARAVVIAVDAPSYVERRLKRALTAQRVPCRVVLEADHLGRAVGRERVVALAVTDTSLGRRVLELAEAVEG